MDIEIFRGIERLLIIIVGGISVVCGWNLFREGVISAASGEFVGKGWKFSLQKAGPGIFFAFFGAAICINSAINGLSIKQPIIIGEDAESNSSSREIYYFAGNSNIDLTTICKAINSLKEIKLKEPEYSLIQISKINEAITLLDSHKESILKEKFRGLIDKYKKIKNKQHNELLPNEVKLIQTLDPYYETLPDKSK